MKTPFIGFFSIGKYILALILFVVIILPLMTQGEEMIIKDITSTTEAILAPEGNSPTTSTEITTIGGVITTTTTSTTVEPATTTASSTEEIKEFHPNIGEVLESLFKKKKEKPAVYPTKVFGRKHINFLHTDDNTNETLIIRTDQKTYLGLTGAEVYFSIENIGPTTETIDLQIYFPKDNGVTAKIERWQEKVAYRTRVLNYGPVNYSCSGKWNGITQTADGEDDYIEYYCADTKESKLCDEISKDLKSCQLRRGVISSHKERRYEDKWEELLLSENVLINIQEAPQKSIPQRFEAEKSTAKGYYIEAGETQYFKMAITFPKDSAGEFYLEAFGSEGGYGLLDPWWGSSWSYRMPIAINNNSNSNTLTEYQIYVEIDSGETNFWSNVKSDGGDLRFLASDDSTELDFWTQYWDSSSDSASIWVQVNSITASATTTIYMYYGNSNATSTSNEIDTFSYSTTTPIFYVVSDLVSGNSVYVNSLASDNDVQLDSQTIQNLAKQGSATFGSPTQTSVLRVEKPVSNQLSGNINDMLAPISFAGTQFAMPSTRNTDYFSIYAPFGTTTVTIYDGTTQEQQQSVGAGTIWNIQNDIATVGIIETSGDPVLVYHRTTNSRDGYILYPATDEDLYGIRSNSYFIGVTTNGTNMNEYSSSNTTASQSNRNRGTMTSNPTGSSGSEGAGNAIRVTSNLPIGVIQQADSDGVESTAFWPKREFGTEYILPGNAQYVVAVCPVTSSPFTIYNASSTSVATGSCASSGTMPTYPGKLCLGNCTNNDTAVYNTGYWVDSDNDDPFFMYYEDDNDGDNAGDETNIPGALQNRKYSYPHPTYVLGSQETQPNLSWATASADFEIWTSSALTWDNGTLLCSGTLTDNNASTISCSSGVLSNSTQYRIQVILENNGGADSGMKGASDFVDHKNVKAGWAGTSPTLGTCGFNDVGTDNGATTCNIAFSGNDVRLTNTGAGDVTIAKTTGTEGFMYLITTDSDVPETNSTSYFNSSIDGITEDSSKITVTGPSTSPTLTFSISDNSIGFGTLSSSESTYATGDTNGTSTEDVAHTISASSNASGGYVITINGNTLGYGSDTISAIGATSAAPTFGTEQFGIRATASGGDGSISSPYASSTAFAFDTVSFPDEIATDANGDDVATIYSLRYLGNIADITEAGLYSTTLTYTVTATF